MMNLVLCKILETKDLSAWSELKPQYFEPPYTAVYSAINRFYEKFNDLPSFEELEVIVRDKQTSSSIQVLKELEIPEDLSIDVLLESIKNNYTQKYTLNKLDNFLDNVPLMDTKEIVEFLSNTSIEIEDITKTSEEVYGMADFDTFDEEELGKRIPLGLSNDFDREVLGLAPSQYIMFGGWRGSGKSVICSNILNNQFEQGNTSVLFSIEMRAREVFDRQLAIKSGVPARKITSGELDYDDKLAIAKSRAEFHLDSFDLVADFKEHKDFKRFEREIRLRPLKPYNQMVIIDNPELTIPNIDANLHQLKSRFGEALKVVVVDYVNALSSTDRYDWKVQIEFSRKLKDIAKKYDVIMVSPFQTDEKGKVNFAKALLQPADYAFNLEAGSDKITFIQTKTRHAKRMDFASRINWQNLQIDPSENLYGEDEEDEDEENEGYGTVSKTSRNKSKKKEEDLV